MGDILLEAVKVILIVLDASVCGILMWSCLTYNAKYGHRLSEWQSILLGILSIPIFTVTAVLVAVLIDKM